MRKKRVRDRRGEREQERRRRRCSERKEWGGGGGGGGGVETRNATDKKLQDKKTLCILIYEYYT